MFAIVTSQPVRYTRGGLIGQRQLRPFAAALSEAFYNWLLWVEICIYWLRGPRRKWQQSFFFNLSHRVVCTGVFNLAILFNSENSISYSRSVKGKLFTWGL